MFAVLNVLRFGFEAYAKKVSEKAAKCSLKITEVLLDADMRLPKFNIYQSAVTPHCFKGHKNSWCPDFLPKETLSDVRSETDLIQCNIVSTGQSVRA